MKYVMVSKVRSFLETNYLHALQIFKQIFFPLNSIFKVAGWETTASSVNPLTTVQKANEWPKHAGGTTSRSSQNSSTLSSSYCARKINMSQRFTWFTMASCHLVVIIVNSSDDNPDCWLICLVRLFLLIFFSVDGNEIRSRRTQHILRNVECICSHCHVLLLHDCSVGTQIPEIHLVEEVSHSLSNGELELCNRKTFTGSNRKFLFETFNFSFQVQFIAIFTHQFQLLFRKCDYPSGFMVWIGLHGVMFLFLFSDFYKRSYVNKRKNKLKIEEEKAAALNGKVHYNDVNNHNHLVNIFTMRPKEQSMIFNEQMSTQNEFSFIHANINECLADAGKHSV